MAKIREFKNEAPPNISVPQDDFLRDQINRINFHCLYREFYRQIKRCNVDLHVDFGEPFAAPYVPGYRDIRTVLDTISRKENNGEKRAGFKAYHQLRTLWEAHRMLITRGYGSFLEYAQRLRFGPKAEVLAADSGFEQLILLVTGRVLTHPKLTALKNLLLEAKQNKEVCAVLTEDCVTANSIAQMLGKLSLNVQVAWPSGKPRVLNTLGSAQHFLDLQMRKLDVLVTASTLQEQVVLEQVDRIYQFTAPDPLKSKGVLVERYRKNWKDRIVHLVLQHPLDQDLYLWAHHTGMAPLVASHEHPASFHPRSVPKSRKKGRDDNQLSLF